MRLLKQRASGATDTALPMDSVGASEAPAHGSGGVRGGKVFRRRRPGPADVDESNGTADPTAAEAVGDKVVRHRNASDLVEEAKRRTTLSLGRGFGSGAPAGAPRRHTSNDDLGSIFEDSSSMDVALGTTVNTSMNDLGGLGKTCSQVTQ